MWLLKLLYGKFINIYVISFKIKNNQLYFVIHADVYSKLYEAALILFKQNCSNASLTAMNGIPLKLKPKDVAKIVKRMVSYQAAV